MIRYISHFLFSFLCNTGFGIRWVIIILMTWLILQYTYKLCHRTREYSSLKNQTLFQGPWGECVEWEVMYSDIFSLNLLRLFYSTILINWPRLVLFLPFVWAVTAAQAALLLTAAIWLNIFACIWDCVTDGLRNDTNKCRDNSSGASQSRKASRKRRNPSKSMSCKEKK